MRISDWSSDVCSSDLAGGRQPSPSACSPDGGQAGGACRQKTSADHRPAPSTQSNPPAGKDSAAGSVSSHPARWRSRSEEHTSELKSLMSISYAGVCLEKQNK